MRVRRFALLLIVVLLVPPSFIYFVHGGNQVGIFDGLLLNGEAWDDDSHGLAFLVVGGVGLCLSAAFLAIWHLQQLRREIREGQMVERATRLH